MTPGDAIGMLHGFRSRYRKILREVAMAACNGSAESQMATLDEGVFGDKGSRFAMSGRGWLTPLAIMLPVPLLSAILI